MSANDPAPIGGGRAAFRKSLAIGGLSSVPEGGVSSVPESEALEESVCSTIDVVDTGVAILCFSSPQLVGMPSL